MKRSPVFFALLMLCALTSTALANGKKQILVGLAHFPPFIEDKGSTIGGLAIDMLDLMNQHQNKYQFEAIPVLVSTRHKTFKLGRYDMSMFDSLDWGWEGLDVEASKPYLKGGEIYIAHKSPGRDEHFFTDFKNKVMVGMDGYHYAFAGFNSDPNYLREHFNMILTKSNLGSIQLITSGSRGDIAVVSKSYLASYLNDFPEDRDKLLISKKLDQAYNHRIIIRKNIEPSVEEINLMLNELEESGQLQKLWKKIILEPSS